MRKINIKRVAYELYKQAWIDSHTTPDARLDELREYYLYCKECVENGDKPETHRALLKKAAILAVCFMSAIKNSVEKSTSSPSISSSY